MNKSIITKIIDMLHREKRNVNGRRVYRQIPSIHMIQIRMGSYLRDHDPTQTSPGPGCGRYDSLADCRADYRGNVIMDYLHSLGDSRYNATTPFMKIFGIIGFSPCFDPAFFG